MRTVTISGGGVAGLALGLALRRREVPVTVIEVGRYPRHRVCGEFISGRGGRVLEELGLGPAMTDAGATLAGDANFFAGGRSTGAWALPEAARCLSRWRLDALLAEAFTAAGGELRCGERYTDRFGEGTVRATGRRVQVAEEGWRWFGLKAHALGVRLAAGLEMHATTRGYVGLCAVEGSRVNVCGLFRARGAVSDLAVAWREWLSGDDGSELRARLNGADWDEASFCSVAGLALRPRDDGNEEVCVGDALTMIPPVTGNGMSLALESAMHAGEPLTTWARGAEPWSTVVRQVRERQRTAFARRLRWAGWLQRLMMQPALARYGVVVGHRWPALNRLLFRLTR
jgi:menaquinone-9 beta-reductase